MKLRIRFAMAFVLAGCLFLGGCTVAGYEIDIDQIYPFHKETENLDGGEHDQHASVTAGKESVTETESPSKETENGFWLDTPGHYGYDSLTEKQKVWYREITDILNAMETDCSLTVEPGQEDPEKSGLELIFHCVKMDHPELFFVEGYRYSSVFSGDQLQEIYFSGIYNVTKEEAQKRAGEIEIAARQILESVPENSSDYEKIKYIYDTVIRNTDYDLDAPDNQNIYSVLVGRSSVCQGYSETMQYLLLKEGIECGLVQGEVNDGEPHAWNFVKADGEYYYVDATWGDISYQNMAGDGNSDPADYVNYDYFCVTTEELLRTHRITEELEMQNTTVPYVYGSSILDALTSINSKGLKYEIIGEEDGNTVRKTIPEAASPIPKNGTVVIYMNGAEEQTVSVPDLTGMNVDRVNSTLAFYGLNVSLSGGGVNNPDAVATAQSIPAGWSVSKGTVVEVTFLVNNSDAG